MAQYMKMKGTYDLLLRKYHTRIKMKNLDSYNPNPIDTSDILLPKELMELCELIAENVHDVWALGRINEGWTYGEVKDPGRKITPLLVPYKDLPESEKEYDRNTAFETLKLVSKLGYDIVKRD